MNKAELVFYVACAVLFFVPCWFIKHKVYDDGVLGRIALLAIVICAFAILGQAGVTYWDAWAAGQGFEKAGYHIEWEETLLVLGFACFLCWHLVRFHRRVARHAEDPKDPQTYLPAPAPLALEARAHQQPDDLTERREARSRATA